ncbi:MAG: PocR ligand-binding domain-containing protein [Myxococcaceae bacterium]
MTQSDLPLPASVPLEGPSRLSRPLSELLPIRQLQQLLDSFNAFFPAVTAILDLEGRVLQASGWQDACTKFHRKVPASCRNCTESDTWLAANVRPGEFVAYRCKNGLWDVVTPLYVDGVHAGNLYTGQFFYDDETVDENWFAERAKSFGYEPATYLDAIRRVPRVKRSHVDHVMKFLVSLTSLLSQLGMANVRLGAELEQRQREQEERRKLEQSMRQAQKLESLGLLAGGIAHDFNNLLTAVSVSLELAGKDVAPHSDAGVALAQGLAATQRAADLTRQLLAYSGRGRFVIEKVDVARLLSENAAMLRSSVPRTIQFTLNEELPVPAVEADRSQLQQVVMNLLINAAEAIGDAPGTVTLTARRAHLTDEIAAQNRLATTPERGVYTLLEVTDTGCGMDTATLERLFDPFFTTKFTGRGLGMAAVHGILVNHHAALTIDSVVGRGTTMSVYLPAAEGRAELAPATAPAALPTPRGMVLVVDDEPFVASALSRLLGRFGFRTLIAEGPERGLELARQHRDALQLAIVDLTMPHMTGTELAAQLHAIAPTLPVVLSSGYDVESTEPAHEHFAGFLRKPYSLDHLVTLLSRVLPSR